MKYSIASLKYGESKHNLFKYSIESLESFECDSMISLDTSYPKHSPINEAPAVITKTKNHVLSTPIALSKRVLEPQSDNVLGFGNSFSDCTTKSRYIVNKKKPKFYIQDENLEKNEKVDRKLDFLSFMGFLGKIVCGYGGR